MNYSESYFVKGAQQNLSSISSMMRGAANGLGCDDETTFNAIPYAMIATKSWSTIMMACFCSCLVGLVGLLPMFVLPWLGGQDAKHSVILRFMLSCACGALLSNAVLHLLPEAYAHASTASTSTIFDPAVEVGVWVLAGLVSFFMLEKIMSAGQSASNEDRATGYINVVVNTLDNLTHGLAVATAFCINPRIGILTTAAIIIHELPHEIADYAILIKASFSWKEAVSFQALTSSACVVGTVLGFVLDVPPIILPFTAGGFIYIALVSLAPDMIHKVHPWSTKGRHVLIRFIAPWLDLLGLLSGLITVYLATLVHIE